jgi:hypothetical protein
VEQPQIDLDRIRETVKVATAEAAEMSTANEALPHGIAALVDDAPAIVAELDRLFRRLGPPAGRDDEK